MENNTNRKSKGPGPGKLIGIIIIQELGEEQVRGDGDESFLNREPAVAAGVE